VEIDEGKLRSHTRRDDRKVRDFERAFADLDRHQLAVSVDERRLARADQRHVIIEDGAHASAAVDYRINRVGELH